MAEYADLFTATTVLIPCAPVLPSLAEQTPGGFSSCHRLLELYSTDLRSLLLGGLCDQIYWLAEAFCFLFFCPEAMHFCVPRDGRC